MKKLKEETINFLQRQGFVIVSTLDMNGSIHSACKGVIKINPNGKVYLFDLYNGVTLRNLKENPNISITAVDEHNFTGYCLKGTARLIRAVELKPDILSLWEERVTSRLAMRVIKNIQGQKGHSKHPEAGFPKPQYLIVMEVNSVIDLSVHQQK